MNDSEPGEIRVMSVLRQVEPQIRVLLHQEATVESSMPNTHRRTKYTTN